MFRLRAPFGEALLEIETDSAAVTAAEPIRVHPVLPKGMRVEDCRLYAFSLNCDVGQIVQVTLRLELLDGWTADFASGEFLDAFELENPAVGVAAIATRDPDWFHEQFGLEILQANNPSIEGNVSSARYRASRAIRFDIQAAVAWTNKPTTDQETISSWFAVDLAMTY